MQILIVGDPPAKLNPRGDSSFFMARAALEAGFAVDWCTPSDISLRNSEVRVRAQSVKRAPAKARPALDKSCARLATDYKSIWIRKDPPFDSNYVSLCWMLSLVEDRVQFVNAPSLLLKHHEKLLPLQALQAGFLTTSDILPTVVAQGKKVDFPENFPDSPVVGKPWLGFAGKRVRKFPTKRAALAAASTREATIYQPFDDLIHQLGDRRVIFIAGKYAGDFVRLPKRGSFVSNLARGGRAVLRERTAEERALCDRIGAFLQATGILFAGVDLIGARVTEMNITSPTGLQTLVDLGGPDLGSTYLQLLNQEA